MASLVISSTECLSIACVGNHLLLLGWEGELQGWATIAEAAPSSAGTTSGTISLAEESTVTGGVFMWQHWERVGIFLGVMSIFPVARLSAS